MTFRLWGENYFNPTTKKWSKTKDADNKRSFNMYVLDPLYKVLFKQISMLIQLLNDVKHRPVPIILRTNINNLIIYLRNI